MHGIPSVSDKLPVLQKTNEDIYTSERAERARNLSVLYNKIANNLRILLVYQRFRQLRVRRALYLHIVCI